ncbi:LysR family transcriptional regulator [Paraglaciecola sp. 2405UD69-4]|uniref:LysR family transcriptional regulator n=1 Tax=Paraglaciecola sp. 2405UD69-4 TaxID=3391836 RepID=UPI0039C91F97
MNIRQLKQFISIAETGNISRSAKLQNISQPALTRSIQNLENEFGVELIDRKAVGVCLTAYGEHLLDYARSMVNDACRVKREITAMHSGERGTLSIGVGPVFSAGFLASTLDRLLAKGPRVEVRLVEGFVENLCEDLRGGKLDAVLSLFPTSFDTSDLSFSGLCEVESVLAASSKHNLASTNNVSRKQLASCNWVIADQKSVANLYHEFLDSVDNPAKVHHVRANSMRLIKNLVQESNYLTILPRILIENELAQGSMVVIDGPMKPWVSIGGIASRASGFRPTVLNDFIGIIKEEFSFTRDRLDLAKSSITIKV